MRWITLFTVASVLGLALYAACTHHPPPYRPEISGHSYSHTAAGVKWLPAARQTRLLGQLACLLRGGAKLLVGPAARGIPTRCVSELECPTRGAWRADGGSLVVPITRSGRQVVEAPLGTLAIVDVRTRAVTAVDPRRELGVWAIAARQPVGEVLYAGTFGAGEGLLATALDGPRSTRVVAPGWATCVGGVDLSHDGRLAAGSWLADPATGEGELRVVELGSRSVVLRRSEDTASVAPTGRSWLAPAFHPTESVLAYLRKCERGSEADAIMVTDFAGPDPVTDCFLMPGKRVLGGGLTWSPDGRYLAAPAATRPGVATFVWLLDLREHRLWKWLSGVEQVAWGPDRP